MSSAAFSPVFFCLFASDKQIKDPEADNLILERLENRVKYSEVNFVRFRYRDFAVSLPEYRILSD